MTPLYHIKLIRRDGTGQTRDDFHATITRVSDGKQLIFISDYKWWLKNVRLRPKRIDAAFRYADKHDKKLAEVEEFTQ